MKNDEKLNRLSVSGWLSYVVFLSSSHSCFIFLSFLSLVILVHLSLAGSAEIERSKSTGCGSMD